MIPSLRTHWSHLAALFAALSIVSTFVLIEAQHSSYVQRLDAFVEEQTTNTGPAGQPPVFPELLGLGGDRLSTIVAITGALLAAIAIYFGARSWRTSGTGKLPRFLSRFGVFLGALSLFWIGTISFGIVL